MTAHDEEDERVVLDLRSGPVSDQFDRHGLPAAAASLLAPQMIGERRIATR